MDIDKVRKILYSNNNEYICGTEALYPEEEDENVCIFSDREGSDGKDEKYEECDAEGRGKSRWSFLCHGFPGPIGEQPDQQGHPGTDRPAVQRNGLHGKLCGPIHGAQENGSDRAGGAGH